MDHSDNIEKGALELVLEEFTNEQKLQNKTVGDLVVAVNGLTNKMNKIDDNLDKPRGITVAVDTMPIQEIVKKGFVDTKLAVATQPQTVIHKFQILLFPEQDAKLFYKIIFGRWFLWLTIMLLLTNLYKFSIHWSDNQKKVRLQEEENARISRAWNYLYFKSGKGTKSLMDTAYTKCFR